MSEKFELPTTDGMTEPPAEVKKDFTFEEAAQSVKYDAAPKDQNTDRPSQDQRQTRALEAIPIGPDGKVLARNNTELLRLCGALISGEGVPKRFDTPTKLFAAIQYVRDLKLPDTAIRQVAPIEGVMSIFGDLPLALAQRSGEVTHFEEQWFDKEYNVICFENKNLTAEVWGAVCMAERGGNGIQSFSFTLDDATQIGKYPEQNKRKPWAAHTKLMLRYRARAIALKSLFADSINGVSIAEYDFDEIDPAPSRDVSAPKKSLNEAVDALSKAEETTEQRGAADSEGPLHNMQ